MAAKRFRRASRQAGALLAVLALLLAPLRVALGADCDLCPPDCPMHATHGERTAAAAEKASASVMKCHRAAAPAAASDDSGDAPRLGRPACDSHGALPGLVLAPMLLPAALPGPRLPGSLHPGTAEPLGAGRAAEPPDTPPPDRRA